MLILGVRYFCEFSTVNIENAIKGALLDVVVIYQRIVCHFTYSRRMNEQSEFGLFLYKIHGPTSVDCMFMLCKGWEDY